MINISYFYNIRFFPKTMLPISTAMWDPKWYHDMLPQWNVYKDKRGVICGVRYEKFAPNEIGGTECGACKGIKNGNCDFIKLYKQKLDKLDFNQTIKNLKDLAEYYGCRDICLMVHEKPDVKCGERWPLKEWFREHGVELQEFHKIERKLI